MTDALRYRGKINLKVEPVANHGSAEVVGGSLWDPRPTSEPGNDVEDALIRQAS